MHSPQKPEELLTDGDGDVSAPVAHTYSVLRALGIWFKLGRNSPATSCRDAAHRRDRLGARGIPLWDELKTIAVSDGNGIGLAHCRADQAFDLDAVRDALGFSDLDKATEDEIGDLGLGYGLVNPFETWNLSDPLIKVPQVFDVGVTTPLGVPGTMMTNAGDRTWSVEFKAHELVHALSNATIAQIADPESEARLGAFDHERKIGIVTGNSPESGMYLWQLTIDATRRILGKHNRGDVSMPPVEVVSLPTMGLSMELDHRLEQVRGPLTAAVQGLAERGAAQVGIACNTTQFFGPELTVLCGDLGSRYKSMPQAVAQWLRNSGVDRVGLVGITYVADLGQWSDYGREFAGLSVEVPAPRGMERIEKIAYEVKSEGPSRKSLTNLHNVLRDEMESDYIVLALTELSTLLPLQGDRKRKDSKVLLDPLRILAESLACEFLDVTFPQAE